MLTLVVVVCLAASIGFWFRRVVREYDTEIERLRHEFRDAPARGLVRTE